MKPYKFYLRDFIGDIPIMILIVLVVNAAIFGAPQLHKLFYPTEIPDFTVVEEMPLVLTEEEILSLYEEALSFGIGLPEKLIVSEFDCQEVGVESGCVKGYARVTYEFPSGFNIREIHIRLEDATPRDNVYLIVLKELVGNAVAAAWLEKHPLLLILYTDEANTLADGLAKMAVADRMNAYWELDSIPEWDGTSKPTCTQLEYIHELSIIGHIRAGGIAKILDFYGCQ